MSADVESTNQYLTFHLCDEIYALDIAMVREVLELRPITRIPKMPGFMRGVINLRGHAVPVADLRLKLGMPKGEDTENTCIIISELEVEGESLLMGALVDSVREVYEMDPEEVSEPPRMGGKVSQEFIKGMGRQDDTFVIIFDIAKVFSSQELATIMEAEGDGRENAEAA